MPLGSPRIQGGTTLSTPTHSPAGFLADTAPTLQAGPLRNTLAPARCQLPHKIFLLEEPPAMPSAHLAVWPDGQGQGSWTPALRMTVT